MDMQKTHLVLLLGVVILSMAMSGLNLELLRSNGRVKAQLDTQIRRELAASAPRPGWVLPSIKGKKRDGLPEEIILQASARKITLPVFDPVNCPACKGIGYSGIS